jgi:hypothetical protein
MCGDVWAFVRACRKTPVDDILACYLLAPLHEHRCTKGTLVVLGGQTCETAGYLTRWVGRLAAVAPETRGQQWSRNQDQRAESFGRVEDQDGYQCGYYIVKETLDVLHT